MPNRIKADNASGLQLISDSSDEIQIQSSTDTVATINSSGITMGSGKNMHSADGQTMTNTPAFSVRLSADENLAENTYTKLTFDSVLFDTDNAFDSTTNYRFTVPAGKAGKYQFNFFARCDSQSNSNLLLSQIRIYKNGGSYAAAYDYDANSYTRAQSHHLTITVSMAEGDFIEGYAYINAVDNTGGIINSSLYTELSGHRLIT